MVKVATIVKVEGRLRVHTETKNQISQQFLQYLNNFFAGKVGHIDDYYVIVQPFNIQVPMKVSAINEGSNTLEVVLTGTFAQQINVPLDFYLYGVVGGNQILIATVLGFTIPQSTIQTSEVLITWDLIFTVETKTFDAIPETSILPPNNTIPAILQLLEIALIPYESYYATNYTPTGPTASISPEPPNTIINIYGTIIQIIFYPYALTDQITNFTVNISYDGISFGSASILNVLPQKGTVLGFVFEILFTS